MRTVQAEGQVIDFSPYSIRTQSDSSSHLGQLVNLADGRSFRYAKAGGTITRGNLALAPAPKANHANIAVQAAAALGANQVTVTLGATAAVVGEYNEGLMVVNDVDGEGSDYSISSHPAASGSANLIVSLYDPIVNVALTTSSQVTLVHNTHNGSVTGTAATRRAAGVAKVTLASGQFGWLQTKGVCSTLIGSAATLGARLMADGSTAGAVTDQTDVTAPQAEVQVGTASIVAGVSTEFNPIVLCID